MFYGCTSLICLTGINTTSSTSKSNMFTSCTSLAQPDAAAQTDIIDANGAVYSYACP